MQLRELSIRTVFDLEKCVYNDNLRSRWWAIFVSNVANEGAPSPLVDRTESPDQAATFADPRAGEANSEKVLTLSRELDAIVAFVRDDLHVKRLRQIWDVVSMTLEERPATEDSPPRPVTKVPLNLVAGTGGDVPS